MAAQMPGSESTAVREGTAPWVDDLERGVLPMTERIGQNDMNRRPSNWTSTYGQQHAWMRFTAFPVGILAPHKVRIYSRRAHFILNWWDPGEKRSLSERIDGDLLAALARARAIDEQLAATGATGASHRARISHADLVARFLADLARRAAAGEIVPATVGRYRTALGHYLAFAESPEIARTVPSATRVDRQFRLGLNAFLATRIVNGNGRGTAGRPMRSANFVILATRAMYEWAADPDRGRLLPDGFRSPFRTAAGRMPVFKGDPLAKPDISVDMAADLVRACDDYQARLFVPLILFGLRAAEPRFAFSVDLADGWLAVPCRPGLLLATKGKRDKRFPLLPELDAFWQSFDT